VELLQRHLDFTKHYLDSLVHVEAPFSFSKPTHTIG
jgi:hypothetical protein